MAPPLTGAKERGLGEKGQGGIIVPRTLLKQLWGIFSVSIFHVSKMPAVLQF